MDEGLLKERSAERGRRWREIWEEAKKLCYLAAPMAAVTLSFFLVTVISLMMVGHLGELALSSTAIAISFTGVTGFSVIFGFASDEMMQNLVNRCEISGLSVALEMRIDCLSLF